jgi:HTH-type transcriptional regulator/antitoxin HipB
LQLGSCIRERRRQISRHQKRFVVVPRPLQPVVLVSSPAAAVRLDTVLRTLAALDLEMVIRPRTKSTAKDIEAIF